MKIEEWQKFPQADRIEYMLEKRRYGIGLYVMYQCMFAVIAIILAVTDMFLGLLGIFLIIMSGYKLFQVNQMNKEAIEKLDEKYRQRYTERILKGRR